MSEPVTSQPGEWGVPLFGVSPCCCGHDCFSLCKNCVLPCLAHRDIAKVLGEDPKKWCFMMLALYLCFPCGALVCGCQQRSAVRKLKDLDGGDVNDLCAMYCCTPCALVQMEKELGTSQKLSKT